MPEIDIDTTPTSLTPHGLSQLVPCPYCRAETGQPCATNKGGQAPRRHQSRSDASSRSAGRDVALFVAKSDDAEWNAGDYLVCQAYSLDPAAKVTVLLVCRTGKDPERNAYRSEVRVVRVLSEQEVTDLELRN